MTTVGDRIETGFNMGHVHRPIGCLEVTKGCSYAECLHEHYKDGLCKVHTDLKWYQEGQSCG